MADATRAQQYILDRIAIAPNGCWIGQVGFSPSTGYCTGSQNGRTKPLHRMGYEAFVGPIPEGLWIDHLCHNNDASCNLGVACPHRRCCNPDHLEAVTPRTNILRGRTPAAANALRTVCPKGHRDSYLPRWSKRDGWKRYCGACAEQRRTELRRPAVERALVRSQEREARNAARQAESSARRAAFRAEILSEHGYRRYKSPTDPCRCEVCRRAVADYARASRAAKRAARLLDMETTPDAS